MKIEFIGPFGWLTSTEIPYIYDSPVATKSGIYLWTVLTPFGDELVWYVGQTGTSFDERFKEHQHLQSDGSYRVYDPDSFVLGQKIRLWGGKYGYCREPKSNFTDRFAKLRLIVPRFLGILRFHLAPVSHNQSEVSGDLEFRSRVEAALAHHFYDQGEIVGRFQEEDVEYLKESKLPTRRLHELHWPPSDATTHVRCYAQRRIRDFPIEVVV